MSLLKKLGNGALRIAATAAHSALKSLWFLGRPKTFGAHAIALTPQGKMVLVKLRYSPGWRVPGGGRRRDEDSVEAALRELREEIGMISHGEVRLARDFEHEVDFKRDTASLVIVHDVRYQPPRWSWEVEQICEADPEALPRDLSPITASWIEELRPLL